MFFILYLRSRKEVVLAISFLAAQRICSKTNGIRRSAHELSEASVRPRPVLRPARPRPRHHRRQDGVLVGAAHHVLPGRGRQDPERGPPGPRLRSRCGQRPPQHARRRIHLHQRPPLPPVLRHHPAPPPQPETGATAGRRELAPRPGRDHRQAESPPGPPQHPQDARGHQAPGLAGVRGTPGPGHEPGRPDPARRQAADPGHRRRWRAGRRRDR